MLPEEKIAFRFSQLRKLRPPVNSESLVKEFAELEVSVLPEGYDAVYLDKSKKHPKPRVIITEDLSKTRRVFTLGHELGHILIPWHIGTHFCRIDADAQLVDELVKKIESQANRFAAELLMPHAWVNDCIKSKRTLKELVDAVKEANVSNHAACIRLLQTLPVGYTFVETNLEGLVRRAQGTIGTAVKLPVENSILSKGYLDNLAEDFVKIQSGNSIFFWWRLASKLEAPDTDNINQNASDILKKIVRETINDKTLGTKVIMQINGVIGAANGSFQRNDRKGDLFTILKQRFAYRTTYEKIVTHRLFDVFLQKRIEEISLRD
jgi:Zn-dependent peptidase ImmA (M78 family)